MGTRPEVARRPFEDVEGLIELLSEQGCVIATGFTSDRELSAVHEHVQPHMNGYTEIRKDLFPPAYRWCGGIFGKSHVVRDVWMQHSPLVRILNHFLTTKITPPGGYEGATFESKPALAFSVTLDIGPGAKPQDIHRDDYLYLHKHDDATQSGYLPGRDMMLLMFVPGVKTVVENGATLVVPFSHLWDDVRVPVDSETAYATMDPGEVLFVLGSTWHAGGGNVTETERRPQHTFFFTRGMYRPEENPYLSYSPDQVLSWSSDSQDLAGLNRDQLPFDRTNYLVAVDYYKELAKRNGSVKA